MRHYMVLLLDGSDDDSMARIDPYWVDRGYGVLCTMVPLNLHRHKVAMPEAHAHMHASDW